MKIEKLKREGLLSSLVVVLLLMAGVLYKNYLDSVKEDLLEDSCFNWALVEKFSDDHLNRSVIIANHYIESKEYRVRLVNVGSGCIRKIEKGDTIFIKYSKANPEVCELVRCSYSSFKPLKESLCCSRE